MAGHGIVSAEDILRGVTGDKVTEEVDVVAAEGGHGTDRLLTPREVASLFRVDPKTITRWAKAGKLRSIKTLGGHRRYRESVVQALLEEDGK